MLARALCVFVSSITTLTFVHFLKMCALAHLSCFSHQTLREEKASHEKDMSNMRARSEEEASQMKESQARALEEVAKKHRLTLENALTNAELDKNRLLAVSTHTQTTHSSLHGLQG